MKTCHIHSAAKYLIYEYIIHHGMLTVELVFT
jgi:hypothetical protein